MSTKDSDSDDSNSSKCLTPPRVPQKKRKYSTAFQDKWLTEFDWLVKSDNYNGECKLCRSKINIKHEGVRALTIHSQSKKHKSSVSNKDSSQSQSISSFFTKKASKEEDSVSAIEATSVYHGIKHHHSYNSQDCTNKLFNTLFPDSSLAKKVSCGRTKCTSICESVLAPAAQEILLNEIKDAEYFSVGIDASNKGNIKMFPVVVQYFHKECGIKQGLLDFYRDPQEKSSDIKEQLCRVLLENNLDINNVSSFAADNASVNYGINNSVYQKLQIDNDKILKANCKCHILHNCTKFALKGIKFDVEALVLKVYSEFSAYAKRTESLKNFHAFLNTEYREILRHVPTRWLSLLPAIERLLFNWPALRAYFIEEGEDECSAIIWEAFKEENSLPLCYCCFLHNVMQIFNNNIKVLESDYVTSTELHDVMIDIRLKITNRKKDAFFGSSVKDHLKKLNETDKATFYRQADIFFQRCLHYLNKWYDYDNSEFSKMSMLSMKNPITWDNLRDLANDLKINIEEDKLYDDFCVLREVQDTIAKSVERVDLRWAKFFSTVEVGVGAMLKKLVSFVLSVPVSNAGCERVFSIVFDIWTKERNRLNEQHVKAEIQTFVNFQMECKEFF